MDNLSNSYADAMDVMLSDNEKIDLIIKLNKTLPEHLRFPERGVALTSDEFLNALNGAARQLERIMLSSGFNPWIGSNIKSVDANVKKLYDVCSFTEFSAIYSKLHNLCIEYDLAIKKLYENNSGQH